MSLVGLKPFKTQASANAGHSVLCCIPPICIQTRLHPVEIVSLAWVLMEAVPLQWLRGWTGCCSLSGSRGLWEAGVVCMESTVNFNRLKS